MNIEIPPVHSEVVDIAIDTIKQGKQAIVFLNTKNSAEKQAEEISIKIKEKNDELEKLSDEILGILPTATKQCKRLSSCVAKGTAFHHAGLNSRQRELIEDSFRSGKIRIICATPTLAAGVDLPAFRTVLKSLKRYGRRGMEYIPVLEFMQMAGRAGRPKYDNVGESICIASSQKEKDELVSMYIYGAPEPIYSKLAAEPVLRTYVLSLISSGMVKNKEELLKFFEKTFFAFQFKDMTKIEMLLAKVLGMLKEWEMIKGNEDDFVSADQLDEKYEPTRLGRRTAELYLDPLTASNLVNGLRKEKQKNAFSYLQLISHTLEMRPLLSVKTKEYEGVQDKISQNELTLLDEGFFADYSEFEESVKTAWFFEEWINEKDEEQLLEKFSIRPGEIKYKTDKADWLLFSCEELCKILLLQDQLKDISKLRLRINYGVKEELLPLVKIEQIGKVRARKLFNNNIKNIKDLNNADISVLKRLLGEKVAEKIKEKLEMN